MKIKKVTLYLVIGIGMGTAFGVANNDIPTYVAMGAALGLILGYIRARRE
ncbi:MAG: hypothetical protein AAGC88_02470 [Bacteroidota bacterium]